MFSHNFPKFENRGDKFIKKILSNYMKIYLLTFSNINKGTRLKFVPKLIRIYVDEYEKQNKTDTFINQINNKNTSVIFGFHIEKLTKNDKKLLKYYSKKLDKIHILFNDIKNVNIIYDKYLTYKKINKECKYIKTAGCIIIKDINTIKNFPCIITSNKSSGGTNMYFCNTKKDILDKYKILETKKIKILQKYIPMIIILIKFFIENLLNQNITITIYQFDFSY